MPKFTLLGYTPIERDINTFNPEDQEQKTPDSVPVYTTDLVEEAFIGMRDGGLMDGTVWTVVTEIKHENDEAKDEFLAYASSKTGKSTPATDDDAISKRSV